jgi:hypothetical protein
MDSPEVSARRASTPEEQHPAIDVIPDRRREQTGAAFFQWLLPTSPKESASGPAESAIGVRARNGAHSMDRATPLLIGSFRNFALGPDDHWLQVGSSDSI